LITNRLSGGPVETTIADIPVMYVESENGPAGSSEAFNRLETSLDSLEGKKFYGAYYYATGQFDPGRPSLEFYKSEKELVCLLPIKTAAPP
jgi:hypothetical protein